MEYFRQEFDSLEAQFAGHAKGLVAKAKQQSIIRGAEVDPLSLAQREGDYKNGVIVEELRAAIAKEQGVVNPAATTETPSPTTDASTKAPRILTHEQKEITLQTLAARFKANGYLHKGVEWARVKASLEAKPEALWSISEMEKAGHEPDVYNFDEINFDIGTCAKNSPGSGSNCVYDEEAAQLKKTNGPDEKFNSSAMAMAKAMGINLMDPHLYENILQRKGKFDMEESCCWLLTDLGLRSTGSALRGFRTSYSVRIFKGDAHHNTDSWDGYCSWRGSLRVEWAA